MSQPDQPSADVVPTAGERSNNAGGALEDLRVLDFSRVLAGPYATMCLADLGADVLKVEHPDGGDDTRAWGPPVNAEGGATYFDSVNRNKRSIALDLADPADRAVAHRLAASADVIVENFRPGTLARHGLDYPQVCRANPTVVYCSITGFGRASTLPGYDLLVQAVGGLMSITGLPGEPTKVGVALVDVLTGTNALAGILAAVRHRDRTRVGQLVEVDLLSGLLAGLVNQAGAYLGAGVVPGAAGNAHPSIVPYRPYAAADGQLVIAVGNDSQFRALCQVIGLAEDSRFATNPDRVAHRTELDQLIQARLAAHDVAHWCALLAQARVPAGPVNSIDKAIDLADQLGLEPVVELGDRGENVPARFVRNPIRFSHTPAGYRRRPPALGADEPWWLGER